MSNKQNDIYEENRREYLAEIPAKTFSMFTVAKDIQVALDQIARFLKIEL